jgi:hypothetical protein
LAVYDRSGAENHHFEKRPGCHGPSGTTHVEAENILAAQNQIWPILLPVQNCSGWLRLMALVYHNSHLGQVHFQCVSVRLR